ncbi:unnamed protein product, partial [Ectocarpus sp. 12 AP-2014]
LRKPRGERDFVAKREAKVGTHGGGSPGIAGVPPRFATSSRPLIYLERNKRHVKGWGGNSYAAEGGKASRDEGTSSINDHTLRRRCFFFSWSGCRRRHAGLRAIGV